MGKKTKNLLQRQPAVAAEADRERTIALKTLWQHFKIMVNGFRGCHKHKSGAESINEPMHNHSDQWKSTWIWYHRGQNSEGVGNEEICSVYLGTTGLNCV